MSSKWSVAAPLGTNGGLRWSLTETSGSATGYDLYIIHARSDGGVKHQHDYATGDRTNAGDAGWTSVGARIYGLIARGVGQYNQALGGRVRGGSREEICRGDRKDRGWRSDRVRGDQRGTKRRGELWKKDRDGQEVPSLTAWAG